jgi:hypothetical protein
MNALGKLLVSTTYLPGSPKGPILGYVDPPENVMQEIKTISKRSWRNHTLLRPDSRAFTWRYKNQKALHTAGTE